MNTPNLVTLIRHGESSGNVLTPDGRATFNCGLANHAYPLTPLGRRQATWLRDALARICPEGFDACYVSPYLRTQQTRELALPDLEPIVDARISERWRGIWHTHGPAFVEANMRWEREAQESQGWYHNCPSGGQSVVEVESQFASFFTDLCLRHPGECVAVFTHGTATIAALRHTQNLTVEEATAWYHGGHVQNCHCFMLEPGTPPWRLVVTDAVAPPKDLR